MTSYSRRRSALQANGFPYAIHLGVAMFALSSVAMGQAAPPPSAATVAPYDCSGQEGPALTSCRQLNADALKGARVSQDPSRNRTHDCSGMSGSSLATCRDLNGEPVAPGGYGVPTGGTAGGVNGYGTAAQPAPSTLQSAPATNATPPSTGTLPSATTATPATTAPLTAPPSLGSPMVPENGQVPPPSDRTELVGPASSNVMPRAAVPAIGAGGASQKSGK
jgi:hypothetical protein